MKPIEHSLLMHIARLEFRKNRNSQWCEIIVSLSLQLSTIFRFSIDVTINFRTKIKMTLHNILYMAILGPKYRIDRLFVSTYSELETVLSPTTTQISDLKIPAIRINNHIRPNLASVTFCVVRWWWPNYIWNKDYNSVCSEYLNLTVFWFDQCFCCIICQM